jgi:hypothetical protein
MVRSGAEGQRAADPPTPVKSLDNVTTLLLSDFERMKYGNLTSLGVQFADSERDGAMIN